MNYFETWYQIQSFFLFHYLIKDRPTKTNPQQNKRFIQLNGLTPTQTHKHSLTHFELQTEWIEFFSSFFFFSFAVGQSNKKWIYFVLFQNRINPIEHNGIFSFIYLFVAVLFVIHYSLYSPIVTVVMWPKVRWVILMCLKRYAYINRNSEDNNNNKKKL